MQQPTDTTPLAPPVRARIPADLETPVSVFLKLKVLGAAFLFESVERGIQMGRYSFIGLAPRTTISLRDGIVTTERSGPDGPTLVTAPLDESDPFAAVRAELAREARSDGDDGPLPPPTAAPWATSATTWCATSSGCPCRRARARPTCPTTASCSRPPWRCSTTCATRSSS